MLNERHPRARGARPDAESALANQLRAELERFWPGPIGLFSDLDSLISLAFLKRYPSPADARGLGEQRLRAFLDPRALQRPQAAGASCWPSSAARPRAGPASSNARPAARLVLSLVAALEPIVAAIQQLERQIAAAVREHPDGAIFLSLFRSPRSVITVADDAGGDRRLPRALPHPRRARRRRRPGRGRARVRQTQGRLLPLGVQQAAARRVRHARRQHPPLAPLGRRPLRPRDRPRSRPPARHPHPRPSLVPRRLAAAGRTAPHTTPPATTASSSMSW